MSQIRTSKDVSLADIQQTLESDLGPTYRVSIGKGSTIKVGKAGVIPSVVRVEKADGMTTMKVATTGLIISRLIQASSINPRIRRALSATYRESTTG